MEINKDVILGFLRENKNFLEEEFGVKKIALFGSYARDRVHKGSDIDILIEVKKKSFDNRFEIKEYLEKNLNRKVDIAYFDSVRPFIMRFIEKDIIYA